MKSRAVALIAALPLLFGFKMFESRNSEVEQGNAAMQAGKAEEALAHYDKAVAKLPAEPGVHLDRGSALYGQSSLGRNSYALEQRGGWIGIRQDAESVRSASSRTRQDCRAHTP